MARRCVQIAIIGASFFVLVATPVPAVSLITPSGSAAQPYQHWADLSHLPAIDRTITVIEQPCPSDPEHAAIACIDLASMRLYSGGRRCGLSGYGAWRSCRFVTMHEIGHVYEFAMPDWKRARFASIVEAQMTWGYVLEEAFADTYGLCALNSRDAPEDVLVPDLTARMFRRACHLIRIPNEKRAPGQ